MSLIKIIGNPSTHPLKFGQSFSFSVYATAATIITPSCGDSLVTLSGALTFTEGNKFTPQTVTITIIADNGIVNGTKKIPVVLTDGNGGTLTVYAVYTEYTDLSYFKGYNWAADRHIFSVSDIATIRNGFINAAFNGNGLPANAVPTAITNGYTGAMHNPSSSMDTANLSNFSSVDKLTFVDTDRLGNTWTFQCYHIKASSPNGGVFFQLTGHGEGGHEDLANALLALGWDIMYCSMPVTGNNTTANSSITLTGSGGHNQILSTGLDDNSTHNHYHLFVSDKIQAYNYLKANYSHTQFALSGISGGASVALALGVCIEDFTKVFSTRGSWITTLAQSSLDYEGGFYPGATLINNMFASYSWHDFYLIMANRGLCKLITNTNDPILIRCTYKYIEKDMQDMANSVSGTFKTAVDTDITYATHAHSVNDIAAITSEL